MSALAALQREFLDALYAEAPGRAGLEVYRANAMANLREALAATYPVVRRLVGDAFFAEAALRFARAEPSRSGDLNEYGESFAEFLAGYAHARSLPYLADVARLEWACHASYLAADGQSLDHAALARVAVESRGDIRFGLHPAARVLRSAHPIVSLWLANQAGEDGTPLHGGAEDALVSRVEGRVEVRRVERFDAELLAALARGATLAQATSAFDAALVESSLAAALARYVREGVICRFSAPRTAA